MVPVNEVTPEGLPDLFIRDLPPVSMPGAPAITQPRIYFGERPSDYVIVGARQPEFDYPANGRPERRPATRGTQTRWTGHDRHRARHDAVAAAVRGPVPRPEPADQRPDHAATASC